MVPTSLRGFAALALPLLLGPTACGGSAAGGGGTTMADSAGVTIATGPLEDRPLAWTLTELFRLGGADEGPGSFTGAHPQTVGTDAAGNIYVLDGREMRVEVFARDGTPIRFQGRKGGGPGELDFAGFLTVHPSGVASVFDYSKRSLVRWGPDGGVLPEIRVDGFFPASPIWLSGDTAVFVQESFAENRRGARVRIAVAGDTTDLPGIESPTSGMIQFSCVGLNLPPLFSPSVVLGTTGRLTATTHQVPYRIDLYEGTRLARSLRRDIRPEAATVEHVARLHPEGMKISFGEGRSCTVPAEELMEKQGVAASVPLIRAVALGPGNRVWVQRYTFADEPPRLDLFDAEGRYLGTLTGKSLPLGFIDEDVVLFAEEDADTGVSQVVAYRVMDGS